LISAEVWCSGVPEENSLLMEFDGVTVEMPALNLVFSQAGNLLGNAVHARYGEEFPIRFDFLDTMGGGRLSFQVHPMTEYIRKHFGMAYTQDESYYMLDAGPNAEVYLGLREGVDRELMKRDLRRAQEGDFEFPAHHYANQWPAKAHDHFLIPAGTVHCSGAQAMVLEISSTPYIFTFKMWDWGRLGLDGKPRPIHLDHAFANIQWDRDTPWVKENLIPVHYAETFIVPANVGGFTVRPVGDAAREEHATLKAWVRTEISPAHLRGRLVTLFQFAITIGIMVALFNNVGMHRLAEAMAEEVGESGFIRWFVVDETWRAMFATEMLPGIVFAGLVLTLPESPRWLVKSGKPERARLVLQRIFREDAGGELEDISETIAGEESTRKRFIDLLDPRYRQPLIVAILLAVFAQFSGINVVFYYGTALLEKTGFQPGSALSGTAVIGFFNMIFTVVAMSLVDRLGRRLLLQIGTIGAIACIVGIGSMFGEGRSSSMLILCPSRTG
jgi:hypothetical protein